MNPSVVHWQPVTQGCPFFQHALAPCFLKAFAAWETLPRSPPLRSGAGGFPCCEDQENYRADANRFQKEHPCVTGCCRSGLPFYGVLGSGPDCTAFSVCNG